MVFEHVHGERGNWWIRPFLSFTVEENGLWPWLAGEGDRRLLLGAGPTQHARSPRQGSEREGRNAPWRSRSFARPFLSFLSKTGVANLLRRRPASALARNRART